MKKGADKIMQKRHIKKLDMELSQLGFGIMRLPMANGWFTDDAYKMIDRAMEVGINYYDTAYRYQEGQSEAFVYDALVKRYPRESFHIADKLPVWECRCKDDMGRIFNTQLERLGVEFIDFYLLHALNKPNWRTAYDQGALDFLEKRKKEGKIRKVGFSLHDNTDALSCIERAFEWDFVQLQINYYDWTVQRVDKSYEYLDIKGIPCFVMEPVGGGRLGKLPEKAEALLKTASPGASVSSWAIRFAAALPNVAVTLSGMSTHEQLEDNIATFSPVVPITQGEQSKLDEVVRIFGSYNAIPCTSCQYCVHGCPGEIDIPQIFQRYNDSIMFENATSFDIDYFGLIPEGKRGDACTDCGICVKKCPQGIGIPQQLINMHRAAVSAAFGVGKEELDYLKNRGSDSITVCFGAGLRGKILQAYLRQNGVDTDYFCDNSESMWGKEVNGVPVVGLKKIQQLAKGVWVDMLVAVGAYNEVKKQLEDSGVIDERFIIVN